MSRDYSFLFFRRKGEGSRQGKGRRETPPAIIANP